MRVTEYVMEGKTLEHCMIPELTLSCVMLFESILQDFVVSAEEV
jgi:hypothetical protein